MIDIVKKLLGVQPDGGTGTDEKTRHHRVLVATCALLLEMAHIDGRFTEEERQGIIALLKDEYGLESSEIASIMEAAQEEVNKSIDLWQFTSVINRYYSEEEKTKVIEMIWKIVFADGILDKYEDYLVHTLADLLRLDHSRFIGAKLAAREEPGKGV